MTLAEELADAIGKVPRDVDQLPVAETVRHLVDTMGCHFFGATLGFPLVLLDEVATNSGDCTVFGTDRSASVTDAALANATLSSSFELDGGGSFVHPGPCVLGAVLSLADHVLVQPDSPPLSGADLVRAVAIGYEASVRVGEWVGFVPEKCIGWHTPSFHGAIGAAAATAAILDLERDQLAHALALAADMAGGGLIHSRNNSKRFHTARAAQTGVMATLLARRGIRAGLDVLEDRRWGYRRAMTYSGEGPVDIEQPDGAEVTRDFGDQWRAWDRIGIKYYPFHSAGQTILDNCRALVVDQHVDPADVRSVRVGLSSFMHEHDKMLLPATDIGDANFCLPFAVAVGLLKHPPRLTEADDPGIAPIFVESIGEPEVARMESLVRFEASDELDAENTYTMDTIVTVTLDDGTEVATRTNYGRAARARGGAGSIAFADTGPAGIRTKFINLASAALGRGCAEGVLERLENVASCPDLGELLEAMRAAGPDPATAPTAKDGR